MFFQPLNLIFFSGTESEICAVKNIVLLFLTQSLSFIEQNPVKLFFKIINKFFDGVYIFTVKSVKPPFSYIIQSKNACNQSAY